jgi:hypothetical protein
MLASRSGYKRSIGRSRVGMDHIRKSFFVLLLQYCIHIATLEYRTHLMEGQVITFAAGKRKHEQGRSRMIGKTWVSIA